MPNKKGKPRKKTKFGSKRPASAMEGGEEDKNPRLDPTLRGPAHPDLSLAADARLGEQPEDAVADMSYVMGESNPEAITPSPPSPARQPG